ncbi:MAG: hypothetical protein COB53_06745 [Elusimicrobia bacterium]|nr:MAG: hypothetical protein COB53_06745 [Elusimicrobiota bacterium]
MRAAAPARRNSGKPAPEPPKNLIEVVPKIGVTDVPGEAALRQLPLLDIKTVREVRISTIYEVTGKYSSSHINQIARELLADPITQEYKVERSATPNAFLMGPHVRVEVWLKKTVSDPIGESTQRAITSLGLAEPVRVRTGRAFHFIGRLSKPQIEKLVLKLLSNPVIHLTKVTQR